MLRYKLGGGMLLNWEIGTKGEGQVPHKVLFVDDEPNVTGALKRSLRKEPYEILTAGSADEALDILSREPIDVVVSDEKMPHISGSEFLATVRVLYPQTIRIILTGQASVEAAMRAINEGEIYRFLTKPWKDQDMAKVIREALDHMNHRAHNEQALEMIRRHFRQNTRKDRSFS